MRLFQLATRAPASRCKLGPTYRALLNQPDKQKLASLHLADTHRDDQEHHRLEASSLNELKPSGEIVGPIFAATEGASL